MPVLWYNSALVNSIRRSAKCIAEIKMSYRVHRFEIDMEKDQVRLEQFLNSLKGEIISIIPNIAKTTILQIYGVTRKINFLLIVEKT